VVQIRLETRLLARLSEAEAVFGNIETMQAFQSSTSQHGVAVTAGAVTVRGQRAKSIGFGNAFNWLIGN
jgi:hypothetical protein